MASQEHVFFADDSGYDGKAQKSFLAMVMDNKLIFVKTSQEAKADIIVATKWRQARVPVVSPDWCRKCRSAGYRCDPSEFILPKPRSAQLDGGAKQTSHVSSSAPHHAEQSSKSTASTASPKNVAIKQSGARGPPSAPVTTHIATAPARQVNLSQMPSSTAPVPQTIRKPIIVNLDPVSPKKTASYATTPSTPSNQVVNVKRSGSLPRPSTPLDISLSSSNQSLTSNAPPLVPTAATPTAPPKTNRPSAPTASNSTTAPSSLNGSRNDIVHVPMKAIAGAQASSTSAPARNPPVIPVEPPHASDAAITSPPKNLTPYVPTDSQIRELKLRLIDSESDDEDDDEQSLDSEPSTPRSASPSLVRNDTKEDQNTLVPSDISDFEEETSFSSVDSDNSPHAKSNPQPNPASSGSSSSSRSGALDSSEDSFHPMSEEEFEEPLEFDEGFDSGKVKDESTAPETAPPSQLMAPEEEPEPILASSAPSEVSTAPPTAPSTAPSIATMTPSASPAASSSTPLEKTTAPTRPQTENVKRTESGTIVKQSASVPPTSSKAKTADIGLQTLSASQDTPFEQNTQSSAPFLNGFGDAVYDSQAVDPVFQSPRHIATASLHPSRTASPVPTPPSPVTTNANAAKQTHLPSAASFAEPPSQANIPPKTSKTAPVATPTPPIKKKRGRPPKVSPGAPRAPNGMDIDETLSENTRSNGLFPPSDDEEATPVKKRVKLSSSSEFIPSPLSSPPAPVAAARSPTTTAPRETAKQTGTATFKGKIKIYLCGTKGAEFESETQELQKLNLKNVEPLVKTVSHATHVVVSDTCDRTESILRAITQGKWVLRYKWFSNLMRTGKVPPEEDFEFVQLPGTRAARLEYAEHGSLRLFQGKIFNTSLLSSAIESRITDLVEAAGGRTGSRNGALTVVEDTSYRSRSGPANSVPVRYVTDCIANNTFFSLKAWEERNRNFIGR